MQRVQGWWWPVPTRIYSCFALPHRIILMCCCESIANDACSKSHRTMLNGCRCQRMPCNSMKFVRAHNTTSSSAPPDVTCRQKLRPRVLGFRARRGVRCLRGESGAVHRSKAEVEATPTVTARARAEALAMGRARAEVKQVGFDFFAIQC